MGGIFLAIILAYLKVKKLDYTNSAKFFTTLLDYTSPGELGVFVNENTMKYIKEDMMDLKGYFDGKYLSNTFSLIRANALIWTFFVNNYLLSKNPCLLICYIGMLILPIYRQECIKNIYKIPIIIIY